jgi:hypothetical protein
MAHDPAFFPGEMMMRILNALREWWARPSARSRIYAAMSYLRWQSGLELQRLAKVSATRFYLLAHDMEAAGLIESREDDGPLDPRRGMRGRRLYRRVAP